MKNAFLSIMMGTLLVIFGIAETGFAQSTIDGEYKGQSGQVGIYKMKLMVVNKNKDNPKYSVKFIGDERSLEYENVEYKDGVLLIFDKGFSLPIKIDGKQAIVTMGGAQFEKIPK